MVYNISALREKGSQFLSFSTAAGWALVVLRHRRSFFNLNHEGSNMAETTLLTREGYAWLQEELDFLRTVRRRQVAEHIRVAKEDGDITENAGYDVAKSEQAFLEGRIMTLEAMLKDVVLIEEDGPTDVVKPGCRVTVIEEGSDPETFQVVGSAEADPAKGRISNESPLGCALLGHRVGEEVSIQAPGGSLRFQIVRIE
jgi:transcription elongation factor GreA